MNGLLLQYLQRLFGRSCLQHIVTFKFEGVSESLQVALLIINEKNGFWHRETEPFLVGRVLKG